MLLSQLTSGIRGLRVAPLLVEPVQRRANLPAARLIRLSRHAADHEHGRLRFLGESGAPDAGTDVDVAAGRCIDALTVELEGGATALNDIELLVLPVLVVLVDDAVAGRVARPRVHAKRRDAELVPNGPVGAAAVTCLLNLRDVRNGKFGHGLEVLRVRARDTGEPAGSPTRNPNSRRVERLADSVACRHESAAFD